MELPPLLPTFASSMSLTPDMKTCGICKQSKTLDNFNTIPHTPAETQKNCQLCNSENSYSKKKNSIKDVCLISVKSGTQPVRFNPK